MAVSSNHGTPQVTGVGLCHCNWSFKKPFNSISVNDFVQKLRWFGDAIVQYCPTILQTRCVFVAFLQMAWLFRWMEQKHSYVHWSNSYKYHLLVSVIERLQRHGSKWPKLLINVYEILFLELFKSFFQHHPKISQIDSNFSFSYPKHSPAPPTSGTTSYHQLGLPDAKGTTASSAKPSVAIPHLGGAGGFSDMGF